MRKIALALAVTLALSGCAKSPQEEFISGLRDITGTSAPDDVILEAGDAICIALDISVGYTVELLSEEFSSDEAFAIIGLSKRTIC